MEKSMEQKEQEPSISPKLAIALKIATTATRILLFFFDLWSQQFNLAKAIISVPIAVGIFVMAEATVWYRVSKSENQVEVHLPTTVCSHLWALSNVILCSMTITPDDIDPTFTFFSVCFGELINYLITGVCVYMVLYHPVLKSLQHFLTIYEPISEAIPLLFMGVYVGSILDLFAFSGSAVLQFYVLTGLLLAYQIVRILFSNWLKDLAKIFFLE